MGNKVSDADKARARDMYYGGSSFRDIGKAVGASASSVGNWARAEGWMRPLLPQEDVDRGEPQIYEKAGAPVEEMAANTDKLTESRRRRWEDQKRDLAAMCADGAQRVFAQIFEPHTLKEVKTVGMGNGVQELRMVEIPLKEPTPAEKKALATTMAILIDKASLLAGDATSRTETSSLSRGQAEDRIKHIRDELAARRPEATIPNPAAARKAV